VVAAVVVVAAAAAAVVTVIIWAGEFVAAGIAGTVVGTVSWQLLAAEDTAVGDIVVGVAVDSVPSFVVEEGPLSVV
jgi:hypothetical protein